MGVLIGRNFIFDGRERDLRSCSLVCAGLRGTSEAGLVCHDSMNKCSPGAAGGAAGNGCWIQSNAGAATPSLQPICDPQEVLAYEEAAALAVQRPYLLIALTVGLVGLFVVVLQLDGGGE